MQVTCPICGGNDTLGLKDKRLEMYKCGRCDHAFSLIREKDRPLYTEDYYTESHSNWFNNPNYGLFDFIDGKVREYVKKDRIRLLDVGCGKGHLLKHIHKRSPGIELYGIDLCDNEFSEPIKFTKADFIKTGFGVKVDVITSVAAIEHMDDISAFFMRSAQILGPGGVVIVTTDNTGGIFFSVARMLKYVGITAPFYSLYEPAHLHHFTNRSLRLLAEKHGFECALQVNHNYPVAAVNLPQANPFARAVYLLGVKMLFATPARFGILQTIVCKKR